MSLDLDPIRKRLAATAEHDLSAKPPKREEYYGDFSECGDHVIVWSAKAGTIPPLAEFIAAAPRDIAALIEEVERLRNESIDTNDGGNPYESLPCGDCDVPYRDHVNEEGAAPCDNFHFCQDTASDLRADCSDLWEANARLRAEVEALHSEIAALVEENIFFDVNLKDCVNFMRDLWPVVGVDLNALRLESDRAAAIETVRAHTAARRQSALLAYLRHDRALGKMDLDSPEADALRDAMDPLWTELTAEEMAFINNYREGDV